jgi:hypothetical protein
MNDFIDHSCVVGPVDCFFVYAAFRPLPQSSEHWKLPKNTIVLGRDNIKGLYGPTFQGRPLFILSQLKPIQGNTIKREYHSFTNARLNSVFKSVSFGKFK